MTDSKRPRDFWDPSTAPSLAKERAAQIEEATDKLFSEMLTMNNRYPDRADVVRWSFAEGWKAADTNPLSIESLPPEVLMKNAYVHGLVKALEAWTTWEGDQIRQEGPYIGKKINELIVNGNEALDPFRKANTNVGD